MSTEPRQRPEALDVPVMGVVGIDSVGIIRLFSTGAERILKYKISEALGSHISVLIPPSYQAELDRYLDLLVPESGTPLKGEGWSLEAYRSDGTSFEMLLSLDRATVDGTPLFVGIITDNPNSDGGRFWLNEFFDVSLELLAVATLDGRFIRLNPAWETRLGHPISELLARPFMDFVHPDDRVATEAAMRSLSDGKYLVGFENRYIANDGTVRWLEWTSKITADRGLIMASAHDVTRRHEIELQLRSARDDAKRASREKSEFLSRMSHELRTPLNSVIGFAQLLAMDDLNAEQHENVESIQKSGRHLLEMINEVLDIAQIEAGMLRLSLEPVSVSEVLNLALSLIAPQAAEREISIPTDVDTGEICVLADRQKLLQILLNILSNAVKYNRSNGVISFEIQDSGGTVSIAVTDTGNGLTNSQMSSIFKPFERLGAEASSVEGTGVGLTLSRSLSQQMNGTLSVASQVGVGSTFILELPQTESTVVPIDTQQEPTIVSPSGPIRELTVLYIEDNIANSELMERALKTQGNISLYTAVQGSIGFDLASQLRPDLLLLDLHLPDISGEEVLRRIRSSPPIAETTVVVCSADASPSQRRHLLATGADEYLTKPIELADLFELVRRVRASEPLDDPASDAN